MSNEDKIRKRKSYMEFKDILDSIRNESSDVVLWKIYKMLDSRNAFGSKTASDYTSESISLLIKDEKILDNS